MPHEPREFRQQLLESEAMNPALRDAYHEELTSILHDVHTPRKRLAALALLVVMIAGFVGEAYTMLFHSGDARFYIAATTMMVACASAAVWIVLDLLRGKSNRRASYKAADVFYGAAGILVLIQLLHGMQAPGSPESTFGVLFMFVFLFVCAAWSLLNRIASTELLLREEMLRIECRVAAIAERLHKAS